jgi:hypothetical protein
MAYITPSNGTLFLTTGSIALSTGLKNSPYLGNIFLFPVEKMSIQGTDVRLLDYYGKHYSNFSVTYRHTFSEVIAYYKTYPDAFVAQCYMNIYNHQASLLLQAIALMEATEKNRFRDEIRQLKARLSSGTLNHEVGNYPQTSFLTDGKDTRKKVREAISLLDYFNSTAYYFEAFAKVIEERGINPLNLSLAGSDLSPEQEKDLMELLEAANAQSSTSAVESSIREIEVNTGVSRWVLLGGLLALVIYMRKRNKSNKRK